MTAPRTTPVSLVLKWSSSSPSVSKGRRTALTPCGQWLGCGTCPSAQGARATALQRARLQRTCTCIGRVRTQDEKDLRSQGGVSLLLCRGGGTEWRISWGRREVAVLISRLFPNLRSHSSRRRSRATAPRSTEAALPQRQQLRQHAPPERPPRAPLRPKGPPRSRRQHLWRDAGGGEIRRVRDGAAVRLFLFCRFTRARAS
jgi:hypothetical protein